MFQKGPINKKQKKNKFIFEAIFVFLAASLLVFGFVVADNQGSGSLTLPSTTSDSANPVMHTLDNVYYALRLGKAASQANAAHVLTPGSAVGPTRLSKF